MNKAHIALSVLALFAIVGGALAFKAMRTGTPAVITTTTVVATLGTIYTLPGGATFYYTKIDKLFTVSPAGVLSTVLTATAQATATLTLQIVNGSQTTTIPNYGTVTALTTTKITAIA